MGGTLHKDNMRAIQMTQFTPRESEKRHKKTTNNMETQPHLPHVSCVANTSQRAASLETVHGGVPTYEVIDTITLNRSGDTLRQASQTGRGVVQIAREVIHVSHHRRIKRFPR